MAEDYISGEKHREMTTQTKPSNGQLPKPLLMAAVGAVLLVVGFAGGMNYQKSHQPKAMTALSTNGPRGGFSSRFSGGQRPDIGSVTAVTPTSITIQNDRTGTSSTLAITSTTQITNNGQTVAASTIQVGDRVLAVASTSDSTQAASIIVNPSFGGGPTTQSAPTTVTN